MFLIEQTAITCTTSLSYLYWQCFLLNEVNTRTASLPFLYLQCFWLNEQQGLMQHFFHFCTDSVSDWMDSKDTYKFSFLFVLTKFLIANCVNHVSGGTKNCVLDAKMLISTLVQAGLALSVGLHPSLCVWHGTVSVISVLTFYSLDRKSLWLIFVVVCSKNPCNLFLLWSTDLLGSSYFLCFLKCITLILVWKNPVCSEFQSLCLQDL